MRKGKPLARTQSAPHRPPAHAKQVLKRQKSSEALPTIGLEQEAQEAQEAQEGEANQPIITRPKHVSINKSRWAKAENNGTFFKFF